MARTKRTTEAERARREASTAGFKQAAKMFAAAADEKPKGAAEPAPIHTPTVGQIDAAEATRVLAWARQHGVPVTRVKVGEAEIELGVPLPPPPAAPSAPRTRMRPPTAQDRADLYAEYGGEAAKEVLRQMGYGPDQEGEEDEDDDEPAIPPPPRRRRR